MNGLANAQQQFAATLFAPFTAVPASVPAATGRRASNGLDAHCDNVVGGLVEALAARYPVVRRMAGDDSFRAVARRFLSVAPSCSPILLRYGETFPCFLRGLGDSASFEYLADIAELEMARVRAYHAATATRAGALALSSLSAGRLHALRMFLHPSVSLIASRFPIVTIWEANRSDERDGMIDRWGTEAALVARPFIDVEVRRLPAGGHAFMSAVHGGATVAEAAKAGKIEAPAFDLTSNLAMLIETNIVVGFDRDH